jgi:hypothetical protein
MVPSCATWSDAHQPIDDLLTAAIASLNVGACPPDQVSIPPTIETSLSGLAHLRMSSGQQTLTVPRQQILSAQLLRNRKLP